VSLTRSFTRILLDIAYDGTDFCGWQRQLGERTVQGEVERALRIATGMETTVYGASRTDAGVHALGQRAHFDSYCTIPPEKFPYVLNNILPFDIRIPRAQRVGEAFHARFSARGKIYTYRIHNHPHASAIRRNTCAHVPVRVHEELMRSASRLVLGTHDFAAFAAAGGTAKSTIRTLYSIDITREGDDITLILHGNAFLYNMVRILVGTLIGIGQGRMDENVLTRALNSGNRLALGITAPARGLELTRIFYEEYQ
jgi:tRNA pseudouridine38-40 synthase